MIVGVDVGGTRIRVTGAGDDVPTEVRPTPSDLTAVPAVVAGAIEALETDPTGIGVACAGLVDHRSGLLRWMPHAAGLDVPIGPALVERFGAPVWVDNDANAAALAEATTGAGAGHRMVLMITVGTGIGAGLVLDGAVERGRGSLGEVGHMRMAEGPMCVCGRTGCWEELASGRALDRAARHVRPDADGARLVELARAGDRAALDAMAGAGRWLAIGIENLVLAFDPDVVVLGGIVATIGSVLLDPLHEHLGSVRGGLAVAGMPPVLVAFHGERAGLEGAIMGAKEVSA